AEYYSAICDLYLYHSNAEVRISEFSKNYPQHPKTVKANHDLASFYYHDKKFSKAIHFFEKVDRAGLDKKELVDYKFKLAYSYLMEKNYSKASLFNEIKNTDGEYKYTATYYAGFVNYKNGSYGEAESDIKSLLDNKEFAEVVPALYLSILCKEKKYNEAIAFVNALDAKGAKYKQADDVNLLAGEAYFQTKDYKNAVSKFEKIPNINKAQSDTAFKYGYALYEQGLYSRSVEALKNVTAKTAIGQYAAYYLGLSYLKLDNKQFALNSFTQAAEMNADTIVIKPKALFYQGKVNFDLRNFEDAIQVFKKFNGKYPKHEFVDESNSLLSEAFLNSSNYQEAIKYIENLPRKTDRAMAAYQKVTFYKAMELFNDNKIDLALEFLDKSLENKKNVAFTQKAYYWRGEGLSILKMYPEAFESYTSIPKGDEFYTTKSYYGAAYALYFQKKYPQAHKYFQDYVTNHKKDNNRINYLDALIRIADCEYVSKKYENALAGYDKALAENPGSDVDYILFQKGSVHEILENYTEAMQNYELLIRRYPTSVYYDNALFQKGNIEYVKNNFESSIKIFTTLINEKQDSKVLPMALLLRGKSYKNTEKVEQSIPDFQKIIDDYPNSGIVKDAILELQESYSRLGKESEFEHVIEEFNKENPEHSDLEKIQYQTAFNAYNSHKADLAITKLKSFMDKYPNSTYNPDIEYFIANAYMQKNDSTNASLYYN
ncbi:MAG TPA: tetratricopeptide repeat protein, partial [Cytophagales bacterium]|nr:tetratricopeptide repeat protein [Cytophagales bacterium]